MKKQIPFDFLSKRKTFFGGSLLKNSHAKKARPISTRNPLHTVLRSSCSKGIHSLLTPRNKQIVKVVIHKAAKRFHIQILEFANVGNHLHLLIRGYERKEIKDFLRTVTALIARYCQNKHKGLQKNIMNDLHEKFWDQRPFTRIVESYRGYKVTRDYVVQNHLEALGVIPYKPRKYIMASG